MSRLFIAIDIPERIKDDISATYMAIPGARWLSESQIHITLRFIGDVTNDIMQRIISSLSTISIAPFELTLKGVGHFPPRKIPRILWVGIAESSNLMRLQSKIENALISIGIEPDHRHFHPHITIARLNKSPNEKIALFITSNSLFSTEMFEVSEFHLYNSHLGKEGAHYEREASFKLHG